VATLDGIVTDAATGATLSGVVVTVSDGAYFGHSARTNGDGYYSLTGVAGRLPLIFGLYGYLQTVRTVTLNRDTRVDVAMLRPFSRNGFGPALFNLPASVRHLRIQTSVGDACETFIARLNGEVLVNVMIGGRCGVGHPLSHSDVYQTTGGALQIEAASFVQWSVQQTDIDEG
jgi:hypothetical protein